MNKRDLMLHRKSVTGFVIASEAKQSQTQRWFFHRMVRRPQLPISDLAESLAMSSGFRHKVSLSGLTESAK